jgi:hypothetical protein
MGGLDSRDDHRLPTSRMQILHICFCVSATHRSLSISVPKTSSPKDPIDDYVHRSSSVIYTSSRDTVLGSDDSPESLSEQPAGEAAQYERGTTRVLRLGSLIECNRAIYFPCLLNRLLHGRCLWFRYPRQLSASWKRP